MNNTFRFGPGRMLLLVFLLLTSAATGLRAGGTPDLQPPGADPVLLLIGDDNFGNFAAFDGPENSRLNFRIGTVGEVVYFGLARAYTSGGEPESTGRYEFQVRSAATGAIVFGPHTIDDDDENLSTYEQAVNGPQVLNPDGYPVGPNSTFIAPAAGDYYVEFSQRNNRKQYIGLWDITVTQNGTEQPGRVYSQNWAFRVPEVDPGLPECAFGAELNTRFYSYTSDGFVTMIDFTDSGFQPLSFNLAFNQTGPGQTGDLLLDRQSVPEQNLTSSSAEHLIFLDEPDPVLFPDGACGNAMATGQLVCQADAGFCLPVTVNVPGQVELILDFNGNGRYDAETDRLLAYSFLAGRNFSACVPWDGLRADGTRPPDGTTVDILVEYTQGVQHWALYDGEYMKNGFCVTPVRPLCGDGGDALLHYDDINIPDEPGNGAPRQVLDGCACRTADCRTWTNFQAEFSDDCTLNNSETSGYGDRNTLNTWWFAASSSTATFDVPLDLATIDGPADHCPDGVVELTLTYGQFNETDSIRWTGPGGPLPELDDQGEVRVMESGSYLAVVTDEFGCESTASYQLLDVECTLNVSVSGIRCVDPGTDLDNEDDLFYATVTVGGSNSAGWNEVTGALSGSYGSTFEAGPYLISGGPVSLTFTDGFYDCCTETVTITPPLACSNGCAITAAEILNRECNDAGTDADPEDDTFTFQMNVRGMNLGSNWVNDRGESGPYDTEVDFGPYPISAGNQVFRFWDVADTTCFFTAIVQPPRSCSSRCIMEATVSNVNCQDGGTPFDPTDDTYTFDWVMGGTNVVAPAYNIDGSGLYGYGTTYTSEPRLIAGSNFTFTATNVADADCTLTFTLDDRPTGCSAACGLAVAESRVVCEQDMYFIELLVTNPNPLSETWTDRDGNTGNYDEFTRVGTIFPNSGVRQLFLTETGNPDCVTTTSVTAPAVEVLCPEAGSRISYDFTRLEFSGELTTDSESVEGAGEVCWMADELTDAGRRYTDRLALQRVDSASSALALFSCYLFAEEGTAFRGAVFSVADEQALDCCDLSNDGPVSATPTNANSVPVLPDSLRPAGLTLQQSFSLALRPNEAYALLTSSRGVGVTGNYTWVVLSADGIELDVRKLNAPDPETTISGVTLSLDLLIPFIGRYENVFASTEIFGLPSVETGCGAPEFTINDLVTGDCEARTINRSFDVSLGDTVLAAACEQSIHFRSLAEADIAWPAQFLQFGCGDAYPTLEDSDHPDPAYSGFPFVYRNGRGVALDGTALDEFRIRYADGEEVRPDGGTNLVRDWTIDDVCRSVTSRFRQTFKLETNGIPYFVCPISNHYCPIVEEDIMLFNTGPWDCRADVAIPRPLTENLCDSAGWTFVTEVLRLTEAGDTVLVATLTADDDRFLDALTPGDYLLHYLGTHPQLQIEDRYCRIRVADQVNPIAVCRTNIEISLPGSGRTGVLVSWVDLGSYDNCGVDSLLIRRQLDADSSGFGQWQNQRVIFDCADVGTALDVQLLVVDTSGNRNYCTSTVLVLDNTDPYCTGLESVSVNCDELPDGFSAYDTLQLRQLFGMPEVVDNCSAEARELAPVVTGDACSPERIRRRFRAIDQHGNFSAGLFVQDIFVTPSLRYAIKFPVDAATDCTDLTDTLVTVGTACDSITVTFTDEVFPGTGGACRRLERTFTATNWCEWDGVSAAIVLGRDEDADGSAGNSDVWLVRTPDSIAVAADSFGATFYRIVTDQPGGRYTYTQSIDIFDEVGPQIALTMLNGICADTSDCRAIVDIGISLFDPCQIEASGVAIGVDFNNNGIVEATSADHGALIGEYPNFTYTAGFPIGTHRITVAAADDCGNETIYEEVFTIWDCYVPTLTANQFRRFDLEQLVEEGDVDNDGVIEEAAVLVDAIELAYCVFTDCSGELIYTVNRVGEAYDSTRTSMYLDCEDRYRVDLEVYVRDRAFNPFRVQPDSTVGGPNWRMEVVTIILQDPMLACNNCQVGESITINGRVNRLDGTPVEAVRITGSAESGSTITSRFGGYQLGGSVGGSYAIRADKDVDPRAGLSTLDILILRRHLLGVEPITNPFLLLAADVNRDGVVSILDVLQLQGLVLARPEYYPTTSPWRFVDASWDGTGLPPEIIYLADATTCTYRHDFIGLRMGDLNGSYVDAGALAGANSPETASGQRPLGLSATDRTFLPGEAVILTLAVRDLDLLTGGQFGLRWTDALTLETLHSTTLNERSNFREEAGSFWSSWSERTAWR